MMIAKTMLNKRPAVVGAVTMKAARIERGFRHASASAGNAITGSATKDANMSCPLGPKSNPSRMIGGHCHDNTVVESFFNFLRRERIRRRLYRSHDEARQDVFDYIEMFYSPKRKHVRNGMLSPVAFEKQQKI